MKEIEKNSGLSTLKLMEIAGTVLAKSLSERVKAGSRILFLCGHGNNGGDGFVTARLLKNYSCTVILMDGKPATRESRANFKKLSLDQVKDVTELKEELKQADVVVDCVYGFGFHGPLSIEMRHLFDLVNRSGKAVFSVDINSGCECDSGYCDPSAIHSKITFALDCYKPFHMLKKEHGMFEDAELLSMGLPHPKQSEYSEMNEDIFFAHFPKKSVNAYKGMEGKTLIIGGCYGMAGALMLNILGAKTVGASYINAAMPDEIYPIVAGKAITAVYHPFGYQTMKEVVEPLIRSAGAIAFGSGAVYLHRKEQCLDLILQESRVPVILDAEALRMLHQNTYILKFVKEPVILTPHIGEFADILSLQKADVMANKVHYAKQFAKEYGVYVVLKGANTIVASPYGEMYINQSGNQALAQAGSGDLLTGMMAGILTMNHDVFMAIKQVVWLHGYLADIGIQNHSIQAFDLEYFPAIMDQLFHKHGF